MKRVNEFSRHTQEMALVRQKNRCASCGETIVALGQKGREKHRFGEGARAHHIQHLKLRGSNSVDNCVILCESCHYSGHEGGNYRLGTIMGARDDFPYFNG